MVDLLARKTLKWKLRDFIDVKTRNMYVSDRRK